MTTTPEQIILTLFKEGDQDLLWAQGDIMRATGWDYEVAGLHLNELMELNLIRRFRVVRQAAKAPRYYYRLTKMGRLQK